MEIRIKHYGKTLYDSECRMVLRKYQLGREDVKDMWISFGLGDIDEYSDEEIRVRLQEKIDIEINRPERNSFSREEKKVDHYFAVANESSGDGSELLPDTHSKRQMEENDELDLAITKVKEHLKAKPDWADIVISHVLYEQSFTEIAARYGQSVPTITEKYKRAIKKLQKLFPNP